MRAEAGSDTGAEGMAPRGTLRFGEPMSAHVAWGVGGPAERYYEPADAEDLCAFLATLPAEEPVFWLGLGSNLLVRDGGIRGTVIRVTGVLDTLERVDERRVRAGAGAPCAKVARFCARAGLGGAEFLAGIPGTMGGALAMNAGAFGGETWSVVQRVETVDHRGVRRWRVPRDYSVGYRTVEGPVGEWFVAAELELAPADPAASLERIREFLRRRAATQPTRQRSCGSVFRNPPGDHAARLVEASGLKGHRIGGAEVSRLHANFILNTGHASAADIEALIAHVQAVVLAGHGLRLVPEVQIVGEAAR